MELPMGALRNHSLGLLFVAAFGQHLEALRWGREHLERILPNFRFLDLPFLTKQVEDKGVFRFR